MYCIKDILVSKNIIKKAKDDKLKQELKILKFEKPVYMGNIMADMIIDHFKGKIFNTKIDYLVPAQQSVRNLRKHNPHPLTVTLERLSKHYKLPICIPFHPWFKPNLGYRPYVSGELKIEATDDILLLKGKHVLLIDDIITTGHTMKRAFDLLNANDVRVTMVVCFQWA